MRIWMHTATAAAALLLSAGVASAAPAVARADVNMRSGPGTSYGVVDVIPDGARVDVRGCDGGWCRVAYAGSNGYTSRSYLSVAGSAVAEGYAAPPAYAVPDEGYYDEPYAYYDDYDTGPVVGFGVGIGSYGGRWHGRWHGRHGHQGAGGWHGGHHDRQHNAGAGIARAPTMRSGGGRMSSGVSPRMHMGGTHTGGARMSGARMGGGFHASGTHMGGGGHTGGGMRAGGGMHTGGGTHTGGGGRTATRR